MQIRLIIRIMRTYDEKEDRHQYVSTPTITAVHSLICRKTQTPGVTLCLSALSICYHTMYVTFFLTAHSLYYHLQSYVCFFHAVTNFTNL